MSTPRFRPNPFTDQVPRRGSTSSKAGLDTYRRLAAIEQAVSANTGVDMDSLNLYRSLGSDLLAYSYDPGFCETTLATHSGALASGSIYATAVYLPARATVTGAITHVATAGVGTWTRGRIGIYDVAGNVLERNNNDLSLWKSTGLIQEPFNAPVDLERGVYYVLYINVRSATTTTPALTSRNGYSELQNVLTQTAFPRAMVLTGQSDLGTSYAFSSFSLSTGSRWVGLY